MFTKQELNVLQSALRNWNGPYCAGAVLNDQEKERNNYALQTANALATRFEEILQHYFEMENSHMP